MNPENKTLGLGTVNKVTSVNPNPMDWDGVVTLRQLNLINFSGLQGWCRPYGDPS